MLNLHIKENTKESHQKLEATVIRQLKSIRSNSDYANILVNFYAYFKAVEHAIAPFVTDEVLTDKHLRRNSSHIKCDIEELGGSVENLPAVQVPVIQSTLEALSALYVLEGSIMGGTYIVQMLNKYGIEKGTSFFSGYGEENPTMWASFLSVLNRYGADPENYARATEISDETFSRFGDVFAANSVSTNA